MQIKSSHGLYQVFFYPSLHDCLTGTTQDLKDPFFIIDEQVFALYQSPIKNTPGFDIHRLQLLSAKEQQKTIDTVLWLISRLIKQGIKKTDTVIAIGGGITQDIVGFVCAILYRGCAWRLIPTTLLAQVDSCIGGKTGVNFESYKNLIGCIYPPQNVHITPQWLNTLSIDAIDSGLCEALKMAYLLDFKSFKQCKELAHLIHQHDNIQQLERGADFFKNLLALVKNSLKIKQDYIEQDEHDKNLRQQLNFGHTFGHAIESQSQFKIPHGIAVGLGIMIESQIACHLGIISNSRLQYINQAFNLLCKKFYSIAATLNTDALLTSALQDKKNNGQNIVCYLPKEPNGVQAYSNRADVFKTYLIQFLSTLS